MQFLIIPYHLLFYMHIYAGHDNGPMNRLSLDSVAPIEPDILRATVGELSMERVRCTDTPGDDPAESKRVALRLLGLLHQVLALHAREQCRGKQPRWEIQECRGVGRESDPSMEFVVVCCYDSTLHTQVAIKLTAVCDESGELKKMHPAQIDHCKGEAEAMRSAGTDRTGGADHVAK